MKALRALAALALTAVALSVPLASANHGAPELVTPGTAQPIFTASISLDGSRMYFVTPESLSADDGDGAQDLYQRVLSTGVTTLVSDRVQAGPDQEVDAGSAGASANGSRVFFATDEQILDEDDDSSQDVYERFGGTTTLISDRVQAGADEELDVLGAGVSRSGTNYFFITTEPLVAADGDSSQDVYLRSGGTTTLVSDRVQAGGDAALGASVGAGGLSDDGSRLLFTTQEPILTADGDANSDLYLYDVSTATTTLVSDRVQAGPDAAENIDSVTGMTRSGSHIFFATEEPILADDTDGPWDDVYRYTVAGGTTTMISDRVQAGADGANHAGVPSSSGVHRPASDDGSQVLFVTSEALTSDDGDTNAFDTYKWSSGTTELVSGRQQAGADENLHAFPHGLSPDGARVVFVSFEAMVSDDGDAAQDVYLREGGVTTLLSDRIQAGADGGANISIALTNKETTRVFFRSTEPLVAADTDTQQDVYERSGGQTTLLSDRQQAGPDENQVINSQTHSEDGSQVLFTIAEQLVDEDNDAVLDVYWASTGAVPPPDSPATAIDDAKTVAEDAGSTTVDVRDNDTDPDATKDLVTAETDGAHGTVAITNAGEDVSYTPDADYCGADSFTYTLSGGDTATVSVTVTCVADPAVAVDNAVTVAEDAGATTVNVRTNDTDVDASKDLVTAATDPAHGTGAVTNAGADVSYTPDADYCGADSFIYTLSGGDTATVTVTVTCVADPAVAVDNAVTVGEDSGATIVNVRANDTDPDATKDLVTGETDGDHGAVAITNAGADVSYTPDADYCGADSFTYTLSGGDTATVTVTVACVADPGVAVDDVVTVAEDSGATTVTVRANDTDVDASKDEVASVTIPAHGVAAVRGGGANVSYTPAADYCGADSFTYTLSGGDAATVSVTVKCVTDPPGPLSSCKPSVGFKRIKVKPARRGLRFKLALKKERGFKVEIFRHSQGRRIEKRRVARFVRKAGEKRHAFRWNGRSAKKDGFYVARVTMRLPGRPDLRQLVFQRRQGKFVARPAHTLRDTCLVLRAFRLASPVFGSKKGRGLVISYRLGGASDVEISVRRGKAVVFAPPKVRSPGDKMVKVRLPAKDLKRGRYKVTIRITRGAQITTGTISAQLL